MSNPDELVGKEINGYKIVRLIGQGKFSFVFKSEKADDQQIVALKLIKIFDMMDAKQREKCLKEVKLLQSVHHPHIIHYVDSFIANNELFIAVEWAERGDLKKIIRRAIEDETFIEESRIWEYTSQIASGLEHMHSRRIMHRDIKPANLFVAADASLKIGDLGLGRFFSSQTYEVLSRVGTPLYMSPEILHGSGYEFKSDVWSLGCITYEMATLRSPFKSDEKMSLYDLFNKINKGVYPPIPNRFSEQLRTLVDFMLRVKPEERLDINQVVELCKLQRENMAKRPKIDPFLIMDDIIEKLRLLDYENDFCRRMNRPQISRIYFSHDYDLDKQKFNYFFELCYWLMSFSKKRTKLIGNLGAFNPKQSEQEKLSQLITDLKSFGVKLPDTLEATNIEKGHGELVCMVINDLLNRELIRRDFKFEHPIIIKESSERLPTPALSPKDDHLTSSTGELIIEEEGRKTPTFDVIVDEGDPRQENMNMNMNIEGEEEDNLQFKYSDATTASWMEEVRKVGSKLDNIYAMVKKGGVLSGGKGKKGKPIEKEVNEEVKQNISPTKQFKEFNINASFEHINRLNKRAAIIREFADSNAFTTFSHFGNTTHDQISLIRKDEARLNRSVRPEYPRELEAVMNRKVTISRELYSLRTNVKNQIDKFDVLTEQSEEINRQIEKQSESITDSSELRHIKQTIENMKKEIQEFDLRIEINRDLLYSNIKKEKLNEEAESVPLGIDELTEKLEDSFHSYHSESSVIPNPLSGVELI